jgi:hypothetical protein
MEERTLIRATTKATADPSLRLKNGYGQDDTFGEVGMILGRARLSLMTPPKADNNKALTRLR